MKSIVILSLLCCSVFVRGQHSRFLNYTIDDPIQTIMNVQNQLKTADATQQPFLEYQLGQSYLLLNLDDKAHINYKKAAKEFKSVGNDYYYDCLFNLYQTSRQNELEHLDSTYSYLNEFFWFAKQKKNPERLGLAYLAYSKINLKEVNKNAESVQIPLAYLDSASYHIQKSDSLSLLFQIEILKGIVHQLNEKPELAKTYYLQALQVATKYQNNADILLAYNNLGKLELDNQNYEEAENYLKLAESIPLKKFQLASYDLIYTNFKTLYQSTHDAERYLVYSTKYDSISSALDIQKQLINISQTELNDKNEQINELSGISTQFKKHKFIYGSIIFFVFCIAAYSLYRWIKSDQKKKRLEVEHQQTTQKLDEMKQLVIKDHIVLKNKAKVYIEELVYIKSEDHYLTLYTKNKKEFIRGKIKDLIQQLPPNFKQTHRSYIVNTNYVKSVSSTHVYLEDKTEIPLSRTYKKNF